MKTDNVELSLLPLELNTVAPGLELALAQEGISAVSSSDWESQRKKYPSIMSERGKFLLYDSSMAGYQSVCRSCVPGQKMIDVSVLRRGWDTDPFQALIDIQTRRGGWRINTNLVTEMVSRYPKGAIRRKLLKALRRKIEDEGGIWLCVSPYPYPYRSAFNFRIDYDEYQAVDFTSIVKQCDTLQSLTSHYVCASAFQQQPQVLDALKDFDVGGHGWIHRTYRDRMQNYGNIQRGMEWLQDQNLDVDGFVSPHGIWNRGLGCVLEDLGIRFSSEFGLAHDELPFFPYMESCFSGRLLSSDEPVEFLRPQSSSVHSGYFSSVLQLPVHPVCLGVLLEAGICDPSIIAEYFFSVVERKFQEGSPAFLYGHPTRRLGQWPVVISTAYRVAQQYPQMWKTTLRNFAQWWHQRNRLCPVVNRKRDGYEVFVNTSSQKWTAAVQFWCGDKVALIPLESTRQLLCPEFLDFQSCCSHNEADGVPQSVPISWKTKLRNWLEIESMSEINQKRISRVSQFFTKSQRSMSEPIRK